MCEDNNCMVVLPTGIEVEITPEFFNIAASLEEIIRDQCYNPHSYNAEDGSSGKWITYPVYADMRNEDGDVHEKRFYGRVSGDIDPVDFCNARAKFGANHLYTGLAAVEIMLHLEKMYGIDFERLERERLASLKV